LAESLAPNIATQLLPRSCWSHVRIAENFRRTNRFGSQQRIKRNGHSILRSRYEEAADAT
jgi:hypothetical protein